METLAANNVRVRAGSNLIDSVETEVPGVGYKTYLQTI